MLRLIALLAAFCAVAHGCPTILTKSQWGGRAPTCQTTMATPVTYVIIHHTAGSSCTTQSTCITQVKNIQNYHMNTNGYCDISYSPESAPEIVDLFTSIIGRSGGGALLPGGASVFGCFLVGEDGNVYEGRGWTTVGAHTPNVSTPSIGISVIGNFMSRNPNTAAQNAVKSLISCGVTKGYIKAAYILKGHRNVTATDCPGNTFYSTITTWPRFQA